MFQQVFDLWLKTDHGTLEHNQFDLFLGHMLRTAPCDMSPSSLVQRAINGLKYLEHSHGSHEVYLRLYQWRSVFEVIARVDPSLPLEDFGKRLDELIKSHFQPTQLEDFFTLVRAGVI